MECNFPKMAEIKLRTFVKGAKEKPLRQEQHGLAGKFMHRNRSEKKVISQVFVHGAWVSKHGSQSMVDIIYKV